MALKKISTPQEVRSANPSIAELRALFNGKVIAPDDVEYDVARTVFPGGLDCRPAAIVRVADSGDMASLVSLGHCRIAQISASK